QESWFPGGCCLVCWSLACWLSEQAQSANTGCCTLPPSSTSLQGPTASPPSLRTSVPLSQRGKRIWAFGEKHLSRVRCGVSKYWTSSQVPRQREPACAQTVTVSRVLATSLLVSMVSPYILRRIWHRSWLGSPLAPRHNCS